MTCDRCFNELDEGEHGPYICPNRAAVARDREARRMVAESLTPAVWGDEIAGGVLIQNGLCNADGTPRRYYSRTEIDRECLRRGLVRWSDVHSEDSLKDARVHNDWLRSGEAQRQSRERDEMRRAGVRPEYQPPPMPKSNPEQRERIKRIAREIAAAHR